MMKKILLTLTFFLALPSLATPVFADQIKGTGLETNLVSYYTLDEESGNADDSAGTNTGANTNVTYSAGKINNGGDFDGTASFNIGSDSNLANNTDGFSVSMWLQTSDNSQTVFYYSNWNSGSSAENFAIWNNNGTDLSVRFNVSGQPVNYVNSSSGVTPTNNTWYHVVATYDGSQLIIYVNGVAHSNTVNVTPFTGGTSYIGQRGNGSLFSLGKIDEVGVWDRELTSSEVSQLYNAGMGITYGELASLINYQPIIWFN